MPTVLIIDDERGVRSFVARAMAIRGWAVSAVDSVKAGMHVARNTPPDVVLCDVVMPGGGVSELLRTMHSEMPGVPVLLMSGHPTAPMSTNAALAGRLRQPRLLEKPFTTRQLEQALNGALREREQQDQHELRES
jgi:DNA-binding NtrC family response regulator